MDAASLIIQEWDLKTSITCKIIFQTNIITRPPKYQYLDNAEKIAKKSFCHMGISFFLGEGVSTAFSSHPPYRLIRFVMCPGWLKIVLGIIWDLFEIILTSLGPSIRFWGQRISKDILKKWSFLLLLRLL